MPPSAMYTLRTLYHFGRWVAIIEFPFWLLRADGCRSVTCSRPWTIYRRKVGVGAHPKNGFFLCGATRSRQRSPRGSASSISPRPANDKCDVFARRGRCPSQYTQSRPILSAPRPAQQRKRRRNWWYCLVSVSYSSLLGQ